MLDAFFFDSARNAPDAPALWVNQRLHTYGELANGAHAVLHALQSYSIPSDADSALGPCLIFANRSEGAYAGILGILAAGRAYVPLGAQFPPERNAAIVRRSGARVMLVDAFCEPMLASLLPLIDPEIRIIHLNDVLASGTETSKLEVDIATTTPTGLGRREDDIAYILFTSGTTGVPKGVKVRHANATAYMRNQLAMNPVIPDARCSQIFDLTFDLSVHDMFVTWGMGACLYVPDSSDALTLSAFVNKHQLTHWYSVPSTAGFLQQFRKLKPDMFPSLRVSMFCGEALPTALARAWKAAAPASVLMNLYGPTEATISCMRYELDAAMLANYTGGVIPLGWSLPGEETLVIDGAGEPVQDGEKGELLLGGHQVAAGYISDNPKDHAKFFERRFASRSALHWYRTGDLASVSEPHGMLFHGRMDSQVKIRGNRIETQDVEHAVQRASEATMVAVIAWPLDENNMPLGLVAFINDSQQDDKTILTGCRLHLPTYAVPDRIVRVETFPVNANGKTDKNALFALCQTADAGETRLAAAG
jgi:amino acid adenylation domain-containing protein